jgi:hypothetical protein
MLKETRENQVYPTDYPDGYPQIEDQNAPDYWYDEDFEDDGSRHWMPPFGFQPPDKFIQDCVQMQDSYYTIPSPAHYARCLTHIKSFNVSAVVASQQTLPVTLNIPIGRSGYRQHDILDITGQHPATHDDQYRHIKMIVKPFV